MSPFRSVQVTLLGAMVALSPLAPACAFGQTANGSPTAPAPRGLVGTPRPVSRTAPSTGPRPVNPGAPLPAAQMKPLPKPSAADRAEQRKLEHDLKICIGC